MGNLTLSDLHMLYLGLFSANSQIYSNYKIPNENIHRREFSKNLRNGALLPSFMVSAKT